MTQEPDSNDSRGKTTSSIWAMAVGMMGLSIPLTAIMQDVAGGAVMLLPLSALGAAAVGTMAVWNPFRRQNSSASKQAEKLIEQQNQVIHDLSERVASLEQILNYEEKLPEAKLRQQPELLSERSSSTSAAPIIQTEPMLKEMPTVLPEVVLPNAPTLPRETASPREIATRAAASRTSRYPAEKPRQRARTRRDSIEG